MKNIEKVVPYIEYEGKKYEFKKNFALMKKLQEMQNDLKNPKENEKIAIKLQGKRAEIDEIMPIFENVKKEYFKDFNPALKEKYLSVKEIVDNLSNETADLLAEMNLSETFAMSYNFAKDFGYEVMKVWYDMPREFYDKMVENFEDENGFDGSREFFTGMIEEVFTNTQAEKTNEFVKYRMAKNDK